MVQRSACADIIGWIAKRTISTAASLMMKWSLIGYTSLLFFFEILILFVWKYESLPP